MTCLRLFNEFRGTTITSSLFRLGDAVKVGGGELDNFLKREGGYHGREGRSITTASITHRRLFVLGMMGEASLLVSIVSSSVASGFRFGAKRSSGGIL